MRQHFPPKKCRSSLNNFNICPNFNISKTLYSGVELCELPPQYVDVLPPTHTHTMLVF